LVEVNVAPGIVLPVTPLVLVYVVVDGVAYEVVPPMVVVVPEGLRVVPVVVP
jgi:hypothetical protein